MPCCQYGPYLAPAGNLINSEKPQNIRHHVSFHMLTLCRVYPRKLVLNLKTPTNRRLSTNLFLSGPSHLMQILRNGLTDYFGDR